ncbi:hypothetical protein JYU34_019948 [Plutella xylostella]|uniref:Uncharacterized protein n=1 Tax=Plutella xylostella TaxID=51655 RepID=A0ABQ7PVL3_PLUXY|nr:hypothetical protein JYU34_019948 [Plutella xylostella]
MEPVPCLSYHEGKPGHRAGNPAQSRSSLNPRSAKTPEPLQLGSLIIAYKLQKRQVYNLTKFETRVSEFQAAFLGCV